MRLYQELLKAQRKEIVTEEEQRIADEYEASLYNSNLTPEQEEAMREFYEIFIPNPHYDNDPEKTGMELELEAMWEQTRKEFRYCADEARMAAEYKARGEQ
jgi:hypothetical protein